MKSKVSYEYDDVENDIFDHNGNFIHTSLDNKTPKPYQNKYIHNYL